MEIKRHKPEEIVTQLRQVEVLVGQDRCDSANQYCRTDALSLAQALWGYGQRPTERAQTSAERE